jgi:HrpA-like RNA helicase
MSLLRVRCCLLKCLPASAVVSSYVFTSRIAAAASGFDHREQRRSEGGKGDRAQSLRLGGNPFGSYSQSDGRHRSGGRWGGGRRFQGSSGGLQVSPSQNRRVNENGSGAEAENVVEADIDVEASVFVRNFLQRTNQSTDEPIAVVLNGHPQQRKLATKSFIVNDVPVTAAGFATRGTHAVAMCHTHAKLLIEHYTTSDAPQSVIRDNRDLKALPTGLLLKSWHVEASVTEATLSVPIKPQSTIVGRPTAAQVAALTSEWENYFSECQNFIAANEAREHYVALQGLRIPVSINPLVNAASKLVEREPTNAQAFHELHNYLQKIGRPSHGASVSMNVSRVGQRCFCARMAIDEAQGVIAHGLAQSDKEAKNRCSMHCMKILALMLTNTKSAAGKHGGKNDDSAVTEHFSKLALTSHQLRLLQYYLLLTKQKSFSTFQHNISDGSYECRLTLGDLTCEAAGITRQAAERKAVESALESLESCDPTFSDVRTFVERFPQFDPSQIPEAVAPPALQEKVKALRLSRGGGPVSDVALLSPETGADNCDASTRKLLETAKLRQRCHRTADALRSALSAMRNSHLYKSKFEQKRASLPLAASHDSIVKTIESNRVTIVCGTTGSGKTTQVPQYIFDRMIEQGVGDLCSIIVTQPRRISATSIAERIAAERLQTIGQQVGYTIRLDARPGKHINLCTTGVLLQILVSTPNLDGISHLIIDEIHDRDVNTDCILALVKEVLKRNSNLHVVLMSATLQAELFSKYFDDAPVLNVEGSLFPVVELFLDEIAVLCKKDGVHSFMFDALQKRSHPSTGSLTSGPPQPPMTDYALLAHVVREAGKAAHGLVGRSILVFLPGWKEINLAKAALERSSSAYHIILLHSSVDAARQRMSFEPAPPGKIKVVLATNIAESGITIDDVGVVIDTGLIKQAAWTIRPAKGVHGAVGGSRTEHFGATNQLATVMASKANCQQRRGRAGRTQGGLCFRLFSKDLWSTIPDHQSPEIHRVPLDSVILRLLAMGYAKPREMLLSFLEPPALRNVEMSMKILQSLGAVDRDERLTTLGRYLSKLPCEPRVGKMIMMGAVLQCLDPVLTVAASSEVKPFEQRRDLSSAIRQRRLAFSMNSSSDHVANINAYNSAVNHGLNTHFTQENFLHNNNLRIISGYKKQFFDILGETGFISDYYRGDQNDRRRAGCDQLFVDRSPLSSDAHSIALVKACLCAGLFPNVALLVPTKGKGKSLTLQTKDNSVLPPSRDSACRRLLAAASHRSSTPHGRHHQRRSVTSVGTVASEIGMHGGPMNDGSSLSALPPPQPNYYIYEDMFRIKDARLEFLVTVSSVSLWAILLFGAGSGTLEFFPSLSICVIDGWIVFRTDEATVNTVTEMRAQLHACVWKKYVNPCDRANNAHIEQLRALCKELLMAPVGAVAGEERGKIVFAHDEDQMRELELETRAAAAAPADDDDEDGEIGSL